MTNTVKKINSYAKREALTISEAVRVTGGDNFDFCTHPREYRTGNYKKTRIVFFWWVKVESYCPDCGCRHWDVHIEF